MTDYPADPFAPSPMRHVPVDVYTGAYRVSGKVPTRFSRVADIVNLYTSSHLVVEEATVSEYVDPTAELRALQVLVLMDEVLFVITRETDAPPRPEMRIPKRPARAQFAIPPFRLTGTVHIAEGSRPVDGILNAADRFMPMTEVTVVCGAHPELGVTAEAIAMQRRLAHLILVTDDDRRDDLLARVLDRDTAERWLHAARDEPGDVP
ncbi:MAG TPA: hypothetical protein VHK63_05620 [Candidatus Limnocylindria bacterium]|nr:hypothetical protein [Candidatus Limnocylindria bacterium]